MNSEQKLSPSSFGNRASFTDNKQYLIDAEILATSASSLDICSSFVRSTEPCDKCI